MDVRGYISQVTNSELWSSGKSKETEYPLMEENHDLATLAKSHNFDIVRIQTNTSLYPLVGFYIFHRWILSGHSVKFSEDTGWPLTPAKEREIVLALLAKAGLRLPKISD